MAYCDQKGNLFMNQAAQDLLDTQKGGNTDGTATWTDAYGLFLLAGKTDCISLQTRQAGHRGTAS